MIQAHAIVDTVIARFADDLGDSAPVYRNHVMRGLNYQSLIQGGTVSDAAALAWAVHDIGIWTAGTFDYLDPSAALVPQLADELDIHDQGAAPRMVLDHHRLRPVDDPEVEAFRRADLVDVSRGVLRSGIPRADIRAVVRAHPYLGFHRWLARGLAGHALRHPTRPAPMLRW